MLRPEHEDVGAFEQAEFLPGLGGGIEMGAMGITEMNEDADFGPDDAGEAAISPGWGISLHEMEVGPVVEDHRKGTPTWLFSFPGCGSPPI